MAHRAISNCARQSQRKLWNTSPVRHWEWMRTNGGGSVGNIAHFERHRLFAAAFGAPLEAVNPE